MTSLEETTEHCQCPRDNKARKYGELGGYPICERCLLIIVPTRPSGDPVSQITFDERTVPDDKAVYLALKQAKPFQGKRGKLYLERRIKQVINKRRSLDKVKKLLDQHGMDALCASVKVLLGDGVFASTDKAKTRFPELFPELPTGGQKREVFEDEVQNETTGLQPAKQVRQGENEPSKEAMKEPHAAVQPQEPPVHLPFGAQHKLMVQLQEYLEHACYAYGQRKMQETLRERGWDCVEAVELHSWMEEFLHRYKTFETESSSEVLEKLFQSVADIRHTAVRRTHTDSVGIKKFLLDAEHLVRLLQVEEYLGVINKLRLHIERVLIELGQNNRFLQVRAEEKKSEIAVERAMLDQLEKATIAETRKGVEEYQALAGSEVMKAIKEAEGVVQEIYLGNREDREDREWDDDEVSVEIVNE